jgi:transcription elongation factor Elf1
MIVVLCPKCETDDISRYNEENNKNGLICNTCGTIFSFGIGNVREIESLNRFIRVGEVRKGTLKNIDRTNLE